MRVCFKRPNQLIPRVQFGSFSSVNQVSSECPDPAPIEQLLSRQILLDFPRKLYVQGATKCSRRYRYYVSKSLVNGGASDNGRGWRLSAPEVERAVGIAARHSLSDRQILPETGSKGNAQLHTPLSGQGADEMLHALVGDDASLKPLKRLIIEKTQGTRFSWRRSCWRYSTRPHLDPRTPHLYYQG